MSSFPLVSAPEYAEIHDLVSLMMEPRTIETLVEGISAPSLLLANVDGAVRHDIVSEQA